MRAKLDLEQKYTQTCSFCHFLPTSKYSYLPSSFLQLWYGRTDHPNIILLTEWNTLVREFSIFSCAGTRICEDIIVNIESASNQILTPELYVTVPITRLSESKKLHSYNDRQVSFPSYFREFSGRAEILLVLRRVFIREINHKCLIKNDKAYNC